MGTINLALNKLATATNYVAPYSPSRAVDGNVSQIPKCSRWMTCVLPSKLTVNLGKVYIINKWSISDLATVGYDTRYANKQVSLLVSADGFQWTQVDSMQGSGTKQFTPRSAQYVQLYIPSNGGYGINPKIASIVEFQVFEADPTPNTLTGFVVTGSDGVVKNYAPTFAPATLQYALTVGADISNVTIKPTATDSNAVVRVNGTVVATGASSTAIPLQTGANTVTITVKPVIGLIATYTLVITRASSAYLSNVTGIPGVIFNKSIYDYSTGFDGSSIKVGIVPEDSNASVAVTFNNVATAYTPSIKLTPVAGENVLKVMVTSAVGGETKVYTFKITK